MSFTFPTSPSVDDTIELNGKTFKWTANGTWDRVAATTSSGGSSSGSSSGSTSARTHYQPDFYTMEISNWVDNVSDTSLFGANLSASKKMRYVDNGNKMLVTAVHTDSVYLMDMSTPYDPSTMTYDGANTVNIVAQETVPYNSKISPDGLNLYVGGSGGDDINQYLLSIPFDLTTATFVANKTIKGTGIHAESSFNNFDMNDDGTRVFIAGTSKDTISSLTLSTPWDITTMSNDNGVWQGMDSYAGTSGLSVAPDGMSFWSQSAGDSSFRYAQQWIMDSAWDINSAKPAGVWMMLPYYYRDSVNSPGATTTGITDTTADNQNFAATLWHPTEKKMWFYHGGYNNYFTGVTWS